jgi:putative hydrolase of the HAD superfamily
MSVAYVLFDLDDTLYPAGAGLMKEISARITRYVAEHLRISLDAADALRREYYLRHGSAVRALVTQHQLDLADFLAYAHDVDMETYLARDADLDCLLGCLQTPKAIFTNAPHAYTDRVLTALGIRQHFTRVFHYEFGDGRGKPDPAVYRKLQAALGMPGGALAMVDDAAKNLAPALALGWKTIWVNPDHHATQVPVEYEVHDLWQVADAFHRLGVMDASHRVMAEHRLAGCAWVERARTDAL